MTKFLITALTAGALFGIALAGIDLLNPVTASAEAERTQVESQHLEAMNQLEEDLAAAKTEAEIAAIRHQQELEEARYQAELARILADQNYYEQMLNIKLNAWQIFLVALVVLAGAVGIALIIVGTKFALVRIEMHSPISPATPITAMQTTKQAASLARPRQHSPNGYEQMRIQAKQHELLERAIMLKLRNLVGNSQYKITREEYNNLPLGQ